jgi:hypothetical protein
MRGTKFSRINENNKERTAQSRYFKPQTRRIGKILKERLAKAIGEDKA